MAFIRQLIQESAHLPDLQWEVAAVSAPCFGAQSSWQLRQVEPSATANSGSTGYLPLEASSCQLPCAVAYQLSGALAWDPSCAHTGAAGTSSPSCLGGTDRAALQAPAYRTKRRRWHFTTVDRRAFVTP